MGGNLSGWLMALQQCRAAHKTSASASANALLQACARKHPQHGCHCSLCVLAAIYKLKVSAPDRQFTIGTIAHTLHSQRCFVDVFGVSGGVGV